MSPSASTEDSSIGLAIIPAADSIHLPGGDSGTHATHTDTNKHVSNHSNSNPFPITNHNANLTQEDDPNLMSQRELDILQLLAEDDENHRRRQQQHQQHRRRKISVSLGNGSFKPSAISKPSMDATTTMDNNVSAGTWEDDPAFEFEGMGGIGGLDGNMSGDVEEMNMNMGMDTGMRMDMGMGMELGGMGMGMGMGMDTGMDLGFGMDSMGMGMGMGMGMDLDTTLGLPMGMPMPLSFSPTTSTDPTDSSTNLTGSSSGMDGLMIPPDLSSSASISSPSHVDDSTSNSLSPSSSSFYSRFGSPSESLSSPMIQELLDIGNHPGSMLANIPEDLFLPSPNQSGFKVDSQQHHQHQHQHQHHGGQQRIPSGMAGMLFPLQYPHEPIMLNTGYGMPVQQRHPPQHRPLFPNQNHHGAEFDAHVNVNVNEHQATGSGHHQHQQGQEQERQLQQGGDFQMSTEAARARSNGQATMEAIHRAAREMLRQNLSAQHEQNQQQHEPEQKPTVSQEITLSSQRLGQNIDQSTILAVPSSRALSTTSPAHTEGDAFSAEYVKGPATAASKPTKPTKKSKKSAPALQSALMQSEPSTDSSGVPTSKRGKVLSHAESLHNKVEKRYRSNVKNALEALRDSVPRLREIYCTSLPEEQAGIDAPDAQGLIGGLPSLGKPTKKTIMEGARMYIEVLENEAQSKRHRLVRAEETLAQFMGKDQFANWQQGEEMLSVAVINTIIGGRERRAQARAQMLGQDSATDDDEDEVEELKLATASKSKKRKSDSSSDSSSSGGKKSKSSITSKAGNVGVAALYSFGFAYSIFPFATEKIAGPVPVPGGSSPSGRVIPDFGENGIPVAHTTLNRLVVFTVAIISLLVVWPLLSAILNKLTGVSSKDARARKEVLKQVPSGNRNAPIYNRLLSVLRVGSLRGLSVELANAAKARVGLNVWPRSMREEEAWIRLLHAYAGGTLRCGMLARFHLECRLWREAQGDAEKAILLALTTNDTGLGDEYWGIARALAMESGDDKMLDRIVKSSWSNCRSVLASIGPTDAPLPAIADQLVVREIADLLVQTFNDLVDDNKVDISAYRRFISTRIEGVPQGTESFALGLVAIGLGNILASPNSQHPALANLLLAEQSKGAAGSMRSADLLVRSLIQLPTSSFSDTLTPLAAAADVIASVCLKYITILKGDNKDRQALIDLRALLADPALEYLFEEDPLEFSSLDIDETESISTVDSAAVAAAGKTDPFADEISKAEESDRRNRFYVQTDRLVDYLTVQCMIT